MLVAVRRARQHADFKYGNRSYCDAPQPLFAMRNSRMSTLKTLERCTVLFVLQLYCAR